MASAAPSSAAAAGTSTTSTCTPVTTTCAPSSSLSTDTSAASSVPAKRSEITAEEKLRVLEWHRANGCNQRRTAAHFRALGPQFRRFNQGTVSRWLLSEGRFKKLVQCRQPSVIRAKSVKHPEVERCLALWLDRLPLSQYMKLTGKEVKAVVRSVYECLQVPSGERLELSNGWLSRFQARHGLKLQKGQGEGATRTEGCLETERGRLRGMIRQFIAAGGGRTLEDVWNMDETSYFFDCSPMVAEHGEVDLMEKMGKRLTVTLAINATGSERLEPIFIGHKSQDAGRLGCGKYYSNSTAWMTGEIFCLWLQTWNQALEAAGRHVLLLVDAVRSHKVDVAGLTNIQLEFFSPLLAEFVQPCCIGLSSIFHTNYRRLVAQRALNKLQAHTNGGDLFGIDQLEAIALARAAWKNLEVDAIVASWMQAQYLPQHVEIQDVHERSGLTVASSASQMTNLLMVKPLQELQDILNALRTESQMHQLCLALHDAASYSRLNLDDAIGSKLTISEIVAMAQVKSCKSVRRLARIDSEGVANAVTLHRDELPAPAPSGPQPPRLDPNDVLDSLLIMENHWRVTGMVLPSVMIELLVRTRENLQKEFAAGQ